MFGSDPNNTMGTNFEKGEMVDSDSNEFKPMYSFYKD